jgi:hypothetical protein
MDAIDQALSQVRAEIERIRQYLAQLQETEKELATLRETRQVIAQQWYVLPADTAPNGIPPSVPPVPSPKPPYARRKRGVGQPLVTDILQLLKSTGRAMAPIEIDTELRKRGRDMHTNAVTSALARLRKNHLVTKDEAAKYSVVTPSGRIEDTIIVSQTSLAGQAYAVLKKVGRPLTGEEITAQLAAEGQQINPRSVVTSLYHCAQDGQLFRRLGAKTFGLLEWGDLITQPPTAQPFLEEDKHQTAWNTLERDVGNDQENEAREDSELLTDATNNN